VTFARGDGLRGTPPADARRDLRTAVDKKVDRDEVEGTAARAATAP